MKPIEFFKLQAKNLFKDYKTQTSLSDPSTGDIRYDYDPKFFDIVTLFDDYTVNQKQFSRMKAQHIISKLAGFTKWEALLNASETELELAKLRYENTHKMELWEWDKYVSELEIANNTTFDAEFQLEVFKATVADVEDYPVFITDYRLDRDIVEAVAKELTESNKHPKPKTKKITGPQITKLPISEPDRQEFIRTAESVFEIVFERMEPENPELTRKLWNVDEYIDNVFLQKDMLPIDRDYALSLVDAFMFHHLLDLAVRADNMSDN